MLCNINLQFSAILSHIDLSHIDLSHIDNSTFDDDESWAIINHASIDNARQDVKRDDDDECSFILIIMICNIDLLL